MTRPHVKDELVKKHTLILGMLETELDNCMVSLTKVICERDFNFI